MKMFETLRELWNCGTKTWSEQILLENGADRFAWCRVAISKKNAVSAECDKAKHNKIRYVCNWEQTENNRDASVSSPVQIVYFSLPFLLIWTFLFDGGKPDSHQPPSILLIVYLQYTFIAVPELLTPSHVRYYFTN